MTNQGVETGLESLRHFIVRVKKSQQSYVGMIIVS